MRKLLLVLSVAGVLKRRGVGEGERDVLGRFLDGRGVACSGDAFGCWSAIISWLHDGRVITYHVFVLRHTLLVT